MRRIRPVGLGSGSIAYVMPVQFPSPGTYTADANIGIAWANPLDHTATIAAKYGFDLNFTAWTAVNLFNAVTVTNLADVNFGIDFITVDAAGADIVTVGSTRGGIISTLLGPSSGSGGYGASLSFVPAPDPNLACGLRAAFHGVAAGTLNTMTIPAIVYFRRSA